MKKIERYQFLSSCLICYKSTLFFPLLEIETRMYHQESTTKWNNEFKSASTVGPGRGGTSYLADFDETWPVWGVHPKLLQSKFKKIWSKPGGSWPHPLFFQQKWPNITPKMVKSKKLYCYKNSTKSFQIFSECYPTQKQSIVYVSFFYD